MKKKIIACLLCLGLIMQPTASVYADDEIIVNSDQGTEIYAGEDEIISTESDSYNDSGTIIEDDANTDDTAWDDTASDGTVSDGTVSDGTVDDTENGDDESLSEDTGESGDEASDEVITEEETADEDSETIIEEETVSGEDASEITDETVSDEDTEDENEKKLTIIGFGSFDEEAHTITVDSSSKPSLSELTSRFPTTLTVKLDDGNDSYLSDIDVTWYCVGDDYEESEGFYFQFSPKWDEDKYVLAAGLDSEKDAPYIPVVVDCDDAVGMETEDEESGVDGVSIAGSASQSENKELVYAYLTGVMGLNNAAACGIMANIQYESSFRSNIYGDGGTSYGLCQWHASRMTALITYCNSYGLDCTSAYGQMRYLDYELHNNYRYVLNAVKSVPNTAAGAYQAGYNWCVKFEVPANKESKGNTRGNCAAYSYWPVYGGRTVTATYTIAYNLNGGTNDSSNPTTYKTAGATITLKNPKRKGFTFKGWYEDSSFTKKITQIKSGSKGNKVLYAKWAKIKYTIKYKLNGGTNKSDNPTKYYVTSKITFRNPTRKGYTFKGWYLDKKFTKKITGISKGTTGNKTLYAKWSKNTTGTYNITYVLNGGTNSASNADTYKTTEGVTLSKAKKNGYFFAGWYTDKACTKKVIRIKKGTTGNVTLYALWYKD